MIWGGLPNYAAEVQEIINKTSATYLRQNDQKFEFLDKRRAELIQLRDAIADSEMAFFEFLNIKANTPTQALQILQQRIHEIERANSRFSIAALQDSIFKDPTILTTLDDISLKAINNAISVIPWKFEDMTGITEDKYYDSIIDHFSNLIEAQTRTSKSGTTVFSKGYFSHAERVGLKRILNISYIHSEKDYFHIEIKTTEDGNLSPVSAELKLKLLNVIRKYTNTQAVQTQQAFRQVITKKLLSLVDNSLMGACIQYEITANADKYDLSRNISSLKGFIQEVWTNAMMSALMGQIGATIPAGNIHSNFGSKGEIPVDMVLKDFNFQIKSYNLVNGKYEVRSGKKNIGTFVRDRAQMSDSDLLIEFFGSYQFNQPFTDNDLVARYEATSMPVSDYASNIYNRFAELTLQLDPVFQSYVDRIIRIDNIFSSNSGGLFADEQLYFNTFFIINDKLVPASAMLQAIIDALDAARDTDLVKFEINTIKPTEGTNTLESIILSSARNKRYSGSIFDVADLVKISYTIYLDFDKVVHNAYSWAMRQGI